MSNRSFESAMKRLEEIASQLEEGELSLDKSLKVYEEGVELTQFCLKKLDESELKIKVLSKDGDLFNLKSIDL